MITLYAGYSFVALVMWGVYAYCRHVFNVAELMMSHRQFWLNILITGLALGTVPCLQANWTFSLMIQHVSVALPWTFGPLIIGVIINVIMASDIDRRLWKTRYPKIPYNRKRLLDAQSQPDTHIFSPLDSHKS